MTRKCLPNHCQRTGATTGSEKKDLLRELSKLPEAVTFGPLASSNIGTSSSACQTTS